MALVGDDRKLGVTRSSSGDATLLKLSGVIDHSFEVDQIAIDLARHVVIDMQEVTRITSFGIRQWVSVLRELDVDYLGFVNCSPVVTAQFNMVQEFGGRGQLISFLAPFLCDHCEHETNKLIDLRTDYQLIEGEPDDIPCPNCGEEMEFDEVADSYFDHARGNPQPRLPPEVTKLLRGGPRKKRKRFNISKELFDDLTALWVSGTLDDARAFKRLANGLQGEIVLILGEVESATDDVVQALLTFAQDLEGGAILARVPEFLARRLEEFGGAHLGDYLRFDSVVARGSCGNRDHEDTYVFHLLRDNPAANIEAWPRCNLCAKRVAPLGAQEFLRKSHLLANFSDAAAKYLSKYGMSPEKRAAQNDAFSPDATRLVLGKYRVVKEIGQGGMGQVFLAERKGPGGFEKKVVLKRIRQDRMAVSKRYTDLFLQEARLAARLTHPHIVQIYDLGLFANEYVIAMEHVDGVDLSTLIRAGEVQKQLWPVEICCRLIANLCSALSAAHEHTDEHGNPKPIIHRDVSPHNVLVSFQGSVKLTDFGVAMIDNDNDTPRDAFTGKLAYAAPEQVLANPPITNERSDIFSAAAVLYECLTMHRLIPRGSRVDMLQAIERGPVPILSYSRSDIPAKLEEVFQKAIARDPEKRYATAQEFERGLESVILEIGNVVSSRQVADWAKEQHSLAQSATVSSAEEQTRMERRQAPPPKMETEVAQTETNFEDISEASEDAKRYSDFEETKLTS